MIYDMKSIDILELDDNLIKAVGKEWMLVTAGEKDYFNTMTASWGGMGWLWNRPVAFVFVRPERYTHEFMEKYSRVSLSFLGEENRNILSFCGTKSGRDTDKVKETGLIPYITENGTVLFEQSRLSMECRKVFKMRLDEAGFIDKSILERWYNEKEGGLHDLYILEIDKVWVRN